jgi:hypothetical protein
MKKLLAGLALCLMFAVALPAMADIIIGNPPNSNNCIPFSCRSIDNGNYEQIYNSTAFSGSINIGSLSFYDTLLNQGPNQGIANLNFSLLLATTAQSVPDGTIPNNAVLFGNYSLNGGLFAFGSTLTFTGAPYLFDPNQGNLELILETSGGSDPNSGVFTGFDATAGGPFSRWCGGCGNGQGYGLVTGFETAVPEPGTLLMMGTGLVGVVGAIRRRLI